MGVFYALATLLTLCSSSMCSLFIGQFICSDADLSSSLRHSGYWYDRQACIMHLMQPCRQSPRMFPNQSIRDCQPRTMWSRAALEVLGILGWRFRLLTFGKQTIRISLSSLHSFSSSILSTLVEVDSGFAAERIRVTNHLYSCTFPIIHMLDEEGSCRSLTL